MGKMYIHLSFLRWFIRHANNPTFISSRRLMSILAVDEPDSRCAGENAAGCGAAVAVR
jgi:hypothetical protein